jgi:hypothetical protein
VSVPVANAASGLLRHDSTSAPLGRDVPSAECQKLCAASEWSRAPTACCGTAEAKPQREAGWAAAGLAGFGENRRYLLSNGRWAKRIAFNRSLFHRMCPQISNASYASNLAPNSQLPDGSSYAQNCDGRLDQM